MTPTDRRLAVAIAISDRSTRIALGVLANADQWLSALEVRGFASTPELGHAARAAPRSIAPSLSLLVAMGLISGRTWRGSRTIHYRILSSGRRAWSAMQTEGLAGSRGIRIERTKRRGG